MPKTAQVSFGGMVRFAATVTGLGANTVTWSITEGMSGGSIGSDGIYSAPATAGKFHVVATSTANAQQSDTAEITVSAPQGTPPDLKTGVWSNLSPGGITFTTNQGTDGKSFGIDWVEIDPGNPRTLYLCIDVNGAWKSTDGGSNWKVLGDPSKVNYDTATGYLDSPIEVRVDPGNPLHLYATQGVRGKSIGFWVSTDGGNNWVEPAAFMKLAKSTTTIDVTSMDVDPSDFKHVIVGSHSQWASGPPGIMETKDGGDSWIAHPGDASWAAASAGVHFLYDPALNIGNSSTWLVCDQGGQFLRTTDSGTTWTKVSSEGITHHGNNLYYTKAGVLYAGASHFPLRSTDNGITWQRVTGGLADWYYYAVYGDGTTLYTQIAFTGDNGGQGLKPYMVSPETDGAAWTPFNGGTQTFSDGPFVMTYDATNHIMYSANWAAGVWALKTQ